VSSPGHDWVNYRPNDGSRTTARIYRNVYGGVRGAITPRLDRLAAEGRRLNNFNVEFSCTVSRAALLTGRYAR